MRFVILAVVLLALVPALVIGASGPGTRFGFWDYGTGLGLIRQMALPAMIGAGVAFIAFLTALFTARALAPLALVATLLIAAAAFVPVKMKQLVDSNPFIHDITTDFENPPAIVAAAGLERKNPPEYVGADPAPRSDLTIAEAQREAFPDIAPVVIDASLEDATARVRSVVEAMGMEILDETQRADAHVIEAAHTSFWFGFIDDFVVRITPLSQGVRIDVRSKSRVGLSDLGANAERVRTFLSKIDAGE